MAIRRQLFGLEAYAPAEIAERLETQGVQRAALPASAKLMLGMVGGGFIGLGAMGQIVLLADPALNAGVGRLLGGVAFAGGYLVAITGGAAVFTTNILMVMTWASRMISTRRLLRSWGLVLLANFIGAGGLALLVVLSGQADLFDGAAGQRMATIAVAKADESFTRALVQGALGNLLICTGVWVAMAGRSVTDKMIAPLLPIALLPIAGFEHCVGNFYYFQTAGLLAALHPEVYEALGQQLAWLPVMRNLVAVTLGNVIGGGLLVGLVFHFVYRRELPQLRARTRTPTTADAPAEAQDRSRKA